MERMDLYNSDRSIFKPTPFVKILLLNQSGAWYAEAVDRAVIRKLEKI